MNAYISLTRNAAKHTSIDMYLMFSMLARVQRIISTMSFIAYAIEKYGLLLNVRYTAQKLVVTDKSLLC